MYRTKTGLALANNESAVGLISIYRGRSSCGRTESLHPMDAQPRQIPQGLPQLAEMNREAYFSILKHWLDDCDRNHLECRRRVIPNEGNCNPLPTRLINVSIEGQLKIWEPPDCTTEEVKYAALSHRWGPEVRYGGGSREEVRTTRENIEERRIHFPTKVLPQTFQDAVIVTRELGLLYLWIDSLCIIQGDEEDWKREAERMETVYSQAYCVLAATRATDTSDGFLKPPKTRDVVVVRGREEMLYICEGIDDFQADVLDSHLNKRGWVLQEHALARRTIHFSHKQTYWECGFGIRCQTLTAMKK